MSSSRRALIATLAGIVVLVFVILSMPPFDVSPKGIVLPIDGYQPANFRSVELYNKGNAPWNAKDLGSISLLYHTTQDSSVEQQTVLEVARQMTALAGGNGLLITQMGHTYPGTPEAMAVIVLRGSVIKTNP